MFMKGVGDFSSGMKLALFLSPKLAAPSLSKGVKLVAERGGLTWFKVGILVSSSTIGLIGLFG